MTGSFDARTASACRRLLLAVLILALAGSSGQAAHRRPYADMSATLGTTTAIPIRGRLVKEKRPPDPADMKPREDITRREMKNAVAQLVLLDAAGNDLIALGEVRTDEEGYVDTALAVKPGRLAPGRYVIEVRQEGVTIGRLRAHLLYPGDRGLVIRSDVDMTYLNTDFASARAKAGLLGMSAREREPLPGMPAVYRALRTGAGGDLDRPLVFISGSPTFFKRTLEARLALDGILHDGLFLKPFGAIARNAKFRPWEIPGDLEEQVGYKLEALLRERLDMPPGMSEILMGDDTESDCAIYALYSRFTSRKLSAEALHDRLVGMKVETFWLDRIDPLMTKVLDVLDTPSPVEAIYINHTGAPNTDEPVERWVIPGVTVYHAGVKPLVADLVERGLVPASLQDDGRVSGKEP